MTPEQQAQVQGAIDRIKREAAAAAAKEITENISTYLRWAGLEGYVLDLKINVECRVGWDWRQPIKFTGVG